MRLSQLDAIKMALETCRIVKAGEYRDAVGNRHSIAEAREAARQGTVTYPPSWEPAPLPAPRFKTSIEVVSETTLDAARRLSTEGAKVAALNFANAHHPGGGFFLGAHAQEESLCRSSALYHCLKGQPFYRHHRKFRAPRYSPSVVYSPAVPVIRGENYELSVPWPLGFITAATPNVRFHSLPDDEVRSLFHERIAKVLSVAVENDHDAVVLGAWGCGAFGNEAQIVAEVLPGHWMGVLPGSFARWFLRFGAM